MLRCWDAGTFGDGEGEGKREEEEGREKDGGRI